MYGYRVLWSTKGSITIFQGTCQIFVLIGQPIYSLRNIRGSINVTGVGAH